MRDDRRKIITDGTNDLSVSATGAAKIDGSAVTQPISAASLPLPSGASTEATLALIKAKTDNLDVALSTRTKPADSQTITGTVNTTPPSNASTNITQVGGNTVDSNSGNKSAGTIRVVLATDQPALTNKLLVTPDSVALPANQSVNVNQIVGVTPSLNTGVRDAGTLRVTVSTNDLVPISAASLPLPTGAATSALQTQPGVDIGDVTINNAAGASAVNVQDGGNSLTVDGTVTVNQPAASTATGTLNALNAAVTLDVSKYLSASLIVTATNYTATVLPEASSDNGTTWNSIGIVAFNATTISNTLNFAATSGSFQFNFVGGAGVTHVRLRVSAFTSGTATSTLTATSFLGDTKNISVVGSITNPVAVTESGTWTVQPGNTQNTTPWLIQDGFKATYSAANTFTPAATPTDLVIIEGSATKTIKVISFQIGTTNTAAGSQQFFLIKRSAADTTGTFVAATQVPHDSSNAAGTVNRVGHFTANPGALGAAVGNINVMRTASPAAVPATFAGVKEDAFVEMIPSLPNLAAQPVTLRGVAQTLAVNFNGAALVLGQTHFYRVVWTEE